MAQDHGLWGVRGDRNPGLPHAPWTVLLHGRIDASCAPMLSVEEVRGAVHQPEGELAQQLRDPQEIQALCNEAFPVCLGRWMFRSTAQGSTFIQT